MKVFLNPGHCPGIDSGAVNEDYDVTEADIVAEIGDKVMYILEDNDIEVMLEQSDNLCGEEGQDYFESVCYHANDWEADLFVSIHCNSFSDGNAHGTEVFYGGETSYRLAEYVQDDLVAKLSTTDRGLKDGNWIMVIKNTNMPAILIETAFISNKEECMILMKRKDDIAQSIAQSIIDFVNEEEG